MVTDKCFACKRYLPVQIPPPYIVRFTKYKFPTLTNDAKFCKSCLLQIKLLMRNAQQARLNLHGSSQTTGTSLETETLNQTDLSQTERRSTRAGTSTATPTVLVRIERVQDTVDRIVRRRPNLLQNQETIRDIESDLDFSILPDSQPQTKENVGGHSSDSSNQIVSSSVSKTTTQKRTPQKRTNNDRDHDSESQTIHYSQIGASRARLVVREYETDDDTSDEDTPPARPLDRVGPVVKKRKVTTTFPHDDDIPIFNTSKFGG